MSKIVSKELQEAIDKLNAAIKGTRKGEYCSPLVFANTIKTTNNGKR